MLNPKQRAYLKSLAHPLKACFQIGKDGLSENLRTDVLNYLNAYYARVNYAGQDLLIEVDSEFAAASVNIEIDGADVAVYNVEIDLKLC